MNIFISEQRNIQYNPLYPKVCQGKYTRNFHIHYLPKKIHQKPPIYICTKKDTPRTPISISEPRNKHQEPPIYIWTKKDTPRTFISISEPRNKHQEKYVQIFWGSLCFFHVLKRRECGFVCTVYVCSLIVLSYQNYSGIVFKKYFLFWVRCCLQF